MATHLCPVCPPGALKVRPHDEEEAPVAAAHANGVHVWPLIAGNGGASGFLALTCVDTTWQHVRVCIRG